MPRFVSSLLLTLVFLGCKSAEQAAVEPLPPGVPPPAYADFFHRTKLQVAAAQDSFYRDNWADVQKAANALQESATVLATYKNEEVPPNLKDQTAKQSKNLADTATILHAACKEQDAQKTTETFQRLHLLIRDLRPEEKK
jgi:hypothetical protein